MSSTLTTVYECIPVSTLTESTSQIHIRSPSSINLPNVQYTYDANVSESDSYHAPKIAQSRTPTPVSHESTIPVNEHSESHWDWSNASAEEVERKYRKTTYLQQLTEIRNDYSAIKLLLQLAQEEDNPTKIFARTVASFHALNKNFTNTHRNAADLVHIDDEGLTRLRNANWEDRLRIVNTAHRYQFGPSIHFAYLINNFEPMLNPTPTHSQPLSERITSSFFSQSFLVSNQFFWSFWDQPSPLTSSPSPPLYESDSHVATKKLVRFATQHKSLDHYDPGWTSPSALSDWTTPAKVSKRQLKRECCCRNKQSKPLIVIKKALEEAVAWIQEEIWALN
ncbi:uncharacterized protein PHACADRAFT_192195 [Phanerochaete carnosa HHB-10118-sp]|uniref:Uncharacterized protein n=1 Tax=Phanerochaete carnosa (strain HHB-10118-sp) TaxID=650164 RepID=K5VAF2_PHACS|nr:uncharacterized protein PHACADRAFT_192195 [Phanerochaete carnosa HHB-10118-sp]EKM59821.1 hypothetical protein PHACADRAFT_192195 [Phanerochaete carnosa HHB-10118-sp]